MRCPLCTLDKEHLIWQNDNFSLIDVSNEDFPCYLRLITKLHVAEITDLPLADRVQMWKLLEVLEGSIREICHPQKINLAQFGNMVPHVHWHITARWSDDRYFPESPFGMRQRDNFSSQTQERKKLTDQLLKVLPDRLNKTLSD